LGATLGRDRPTLPRPCCSGDRLIQLDPTHRSSDFDVDQQFYLFYFSHPPNPRPGANMTTTDKAKNTAQEAKGKAKETIGKAIGNDDLEAKGKTDQAKGNLKQAGENVKDVFKK
jgi:uncharacterized protein YjbJ (UPF0337 family)